MYVYNSARISTYICVTWWRYAREIDFFTYIYTHTFAGAAYSRTEYYNSTHTHTHTNAPNVLRGVVFPTLWYCVSEKRHYFHYAYNTSERHPRIRVNQSGVKDTRTTGGMASVVRPYLYINSLPKRFAVLSEE